MSWVLNDAPDVPPQCLAVLIGLANHAHANGRAAYPSQERLAHYARKSVRSVQNDLKTLAGLGLIRRGDQRHTAFLPADRRPVVYDLAMERRRPLPGALDPFAEPQSGRPSEAPQPAADRGEADCAPVSDRGEARSRTGRSVLPTGAKRASGEPSLTVQNQERARSLRGGAALPTDPRAGQCPRHRGSPAHNCGPCRAEALGGAA
ncbi:helix-turn-helix domain-containing protein [Micromonospora sp. U56]|uniref:helix-turn-helix domain-containing protein n=1 Tax=Micromonospora sp. U56 TaxID=2824900 RepID=UPI001B367C38|nr:helix-turn-helix domain-containing protein [Micromonospora sp. U56]MBQ0893437.1 helix-turn-helix domain-containing protein [Micromonospora sp. U56]